MQLELIGCEELERWYTRMDKGHSDLASIGVGSDRQEEEVREVASDIPLKRPL